MFPSCLGFLEQRSIVIFVDLDSRDTRQLPIHGSEYRMQIQLEWIEYIEICLEKLKIESERWSLMIKYLGLHLLNFKCK